MTNQVAFYDENGDIIVITRHKQGEFPWLIVLIILLVMGICGLSIDQPYENPKGIRYCSWYELREC